MNRVFPLVLAAGTTFLLTASALLMLGYLSQVRQPMGVIHDALIIETARSQQDVARITSLKQLPVIDDGPLAHELALVVDTLAHRLRTLAGTATHLPAFQQEAMSNHLRRAEHFLDLLASAAASRAPANTDDTLPGLGFGR